MSLVSLPPLVEPASELTVEEVRRYSRHLIIPDVGMSGQKRLKNAKVLVVGAGGPLFAQPGQENLRTQRADVVRRHRLPTRFRMDSEPIPLVPKIHLEGRRASSPLQAETCARNKRARRRPILR